MLVSEILKNHANIILFSKRKVSNLKCRCFFFKEVSGYVVHWMHQGSFQEIIHSMIPRSKEDLGRWLNDHCKLFMRDTENIDS